MDNRQIPHSEDFDKLRDLHHGISPEEYTTYSGSDVQPAIHVPGYAPIGRPSRFVPMRDLQTISVSSARSVSAVRSLGESNADEYTRGARTYAGSMILTDGSQSSFSQVLTMDANESGYPQRFFIDQMPEFNITLTAINEYGNSVTRTVLGITLVNYGTTVSVDNMFTESQYTYVAKHVTPFLPGDLWRKLTLVEYKGQKLNLDTYLDGLFDRGVEDLHFPEGATKASDLLDSGSVPL